MSRLLLALLAMGCTPPSTTITLPVEARIAGSVAACGEQYAPPLGSSTVELVDLRMYLSELELVYGDGETEPATLVSDGRWQTDAVALLDFEDGTGLCQTESPATNTALVFDVPDREYTGLRFTVGVPQDLNHLDVATAEPPLDLPTMYWAWQTGHKFVRMELANDQVAPDNKWFFHLGSLDCSSLSAATAPDGACGRPNLPRIAVELDPSTDTLVLDLDGLLDGVDIGADTPDSPTGCMSHPLDAGECPSIFANLGLSWETGTCTNDCSDQKAFTAP